jgi:hypothetical protein
MSAKLAGCSLFSKLGLKKGYYQIPMAEEDISKTAVTTPFRLFEFVRMPFGLLNTGQSFQRLMDSIMGDQEAAFVYLDNVIVASMPEQHEQALRRGVIDAASPGIGVKSGEQRGCIHVNIGLPP